jgi:hypothetical protein
MQLIKRIFMIYLFFIILGHHAKRVKQGKSPKTVAQRGKTDSASAQK